MFTRVSPYNWDLVNFWLFQHVIPSHMYSSRHVISNFLIDNITDRNSPTNLLLFTISYIHLQGTIFLLNFLTDSITDCNSPTNLLLFTISYIHLQGSTFLLRFMPNSTKVNK
jgi:hypothetical protein